MTTDAALRVVLNVRELEENRALRDKLATIEDRFPWVLEEIEKPLKTRQERTMEQDPLDFFLTETDTFSLRIHKFMPFNDFKYMFFAWVKENNLVRPAFTKDFYLHIFRELGISVTQRETREYHNEERMEEVWLCGIDVAGN